MARTVKNSGRLYVDNAQRLDELLQGRPRPPRADWIIPSNRRLTVVQRYYRYHPPGNGRIRIDRLGTSTHFPIEIQESDSDLAGTSTEHAIEIEEDDSDTEGNPTEQSAGEGAEEM